MATPTQFMERVGLTREGEIWTASLDGEPVQSSVELADIRRRLVELYVAEPRVTKDGRQLRQYPPSKLPRKDMESLFRGLDRLVRGEPVRQEERRGAPSAGVRVRGDGLSVRHFDGVEYKQWWCRLCDSGKPPKSSVRDAQTIGDVFAGWDVHKASGAHVDLVLTRAAVDAVAEGLGAR